jgi:tetratricopeptide (TPR) repeat protein
MISKKNYIWLLVIFLLLSCNQKNEQTIMNKEQREIQNKIVEKYVTNCAEKYNYRFQMKEWQNCLDKGLEQDSTIAYLWQQKAMPYFKLRKYEVGMKFLDKAVYYNQKRWLDYRGFIKCIFVKNYKEAISDFEKCISLYGNNDVMDHSYNFYIALSYLQLNKFKKAEKILIEEIKEQKTKWAEPNFLDVFYLGICYYEQENYKKAIDCFDDTLKQYKTFSDAKYYKSICLLKIGEDKKSREMYKEFKVDSENGYTISEGNSAYEPYPYQLKW